MFSVKTLGRWAVCKAGKQGGVDVPSNKGANRVEKFGDVCKVRGGAVCFTMFHSVCRNRAQHLEI